MLLIFWNSAGVVYFKLIPNGETIKAVNYCEQLNRVQQNLIRKHLVLINRKGVIVIQDNARPHSANLTRNKLKELKWEILEHPPYSPDSASSDYNLFRSMELFLRGRRFHNRLDVYNAVDKFISSKSPKFFACGIDLLPIRWQAVLDSNGEYIID